jgi:pseudaminic acid biosynthesis-associated methylase
MEAKSGKRSGEADRLEALWSGPFGRAYSERNADAGAGRGAFWTELLKTYPVESVLEVGCNVGANLRWISRLVPPSSVYGVDVNESALRSLQRNAPGVNAIRGSGRQLDFPDESFDLVFTSGVLIHQADESLLKVMSEVVRTSRRYVFCAEYFADEPEEIAYRGERGALFKRDYGRLYAASFPNLELLATGVLGRDQGWDDVTWWLFEKRPDSSS